MDKWILSRLANTLVTIERSMDDFNFHIATTALKTFFYTNFCDVYLVNSIDDTLSFLERKIIAFPILGNNQN